MPINARNLRQKEISRMKNTMRNMHEMNKQVGDRRNTAHGVFTSAAYQLNRISNNNGAAIFGSGTGTTVAP